MRLVVTETADADIFRMFQQGIERFGPAQAVRYLEGLEQSYSQILAFPHANQIRNELAVPQYVHRYKAHLIFYFVQEETIIITRIRHGREDWIEDD